MGKIVVLVSRRTLNHIVDVAARFESMRFHQSFDNGLLVVWQHERVEGTLVPLDLVDTRDGEFKPELLAESESKNDRASNEKLLFRELALYRCFLTGDLFNVLLPHLIAIGVQLNFHDHVLVMIILDQLILSNGLVRLAKLITSSLTSSFFIRAALLAISAAACITILVFGVIEYIRVLSLKGRDRVVRIYPSVDCRINHNPAVDVDFDVLPLLLVKRHAFVELILHTLEADKLLATFY